jgi:hypothetical protein
MGSNAAGRGVARSDARVVCAWGLARGARALGVAVQLIVMAVTLAAESEATAPGDYAVPPGCASRAAWHAGLEARLRADPRLQAAGESVSVHVEYHPHGSTGGGSYAGWLENTAGSPESARRVQGRRCAEVLEALTLMAVLSLEGDLFQSPVQQLEPDAPEAPVESLDVIVEPSDSAEPDALGAPDALDADRTRSGRQTRGLALGIIGFGLLHMGIAPGTSLDAGLGLIATASLPGFQPWVLVGAYFGTAAQTKGVETAAVRFSHWSARALGCPWRYPLDGWLALRPCLGVDVGRMRGEGLRVPDASTRSAPWVSALAELRLDAVVLEAVRLGVAAGPVVPLVRPRFYFLPGEVAYQAPLLGLDANVFASVLF